MAQLQPSTSDQTSDRTWGRLTRDLLGRPAGVTVHAYANGDELMGDAALSHCACFIIDHRLAGMTGLDLVTALRRQRIATPAILITSHPTGILLKSAARAGIPIVEKPLLGNALIDCVRAALANPPAAH